MIATLWLCLATSAAGYQEPGATPAQDVEIREAGSEALSPEEAFEALEEEFDDAMTAFSEAYRAADEADRQGIYETQYPNPDDYADRFMALAEENAGSPTAAKALLWVAQQSRDEDKSGHAIDVLTKEHIEDAAISELCPLLERRYSDGETLLRTIMEKSPHENVKGAACFSLGKQLMAMGDMATTLQAAGDKMAEQYRGYYGEEAVARILAASPAELAANAETTFVLASQQYGEATYRGSTVAELSERNLFQLRNLQIGMVAPDIEAEDIAGVTFKLSDYRGKVVVLDFWGNW